MPDWGKGIGLLVPLLYGCGDVSVAEERNTAPVVEILQLDAISVEGTHATYTNNDGGRTVRIGFDVPGERVDPTYYHAAERIGALGDVIAVLDTYGSGAAGGERCAENGREAWVRTFSTARRRQLGAELVQSCIERVEAGDPPVRWSGDGFRTTGPSPRTFQIGPGGMAERR